MQRMEPGSLADGAECGSDDTEGGGRGRSGGPVHTNTSPGIPGRVFVCLTPSLRPHPPRAPVSPPPNSAPSASDPGTSATQTKTVVLKITPHSQTQSLPGAGTCRRNQPRPAPGGRGPRTATPGGRRALISQARAGSGRGVEVTVLRGSF